MKYIKRVPIHTKGFFKLCVLKHNSIQKKDNPLTTPYVDPESGVERPDERRYRCQNSLQVILIPFPFGDASMCAFLQLLFKLFELSDVAYEFTLGCTKVHCQDSEAPNRMRIWFIHSDVQIRQRGEDVGGGG